MPKIQKPEYSSSEGKHLLRSFAKRHAKERLYEQSLQMLYLKKPESNAVTGTLQNIPERSVPETPSPSP